MKPDNREGPVFEWGVIQETRTVHVIQLKTQTGSFLGLHLNEPMVFMRGDRVQVSLSMLENGHPTSKYNAFGKGWLWCGYTNPTAKITFTVWPHAQRKQEIFVRYGKIGEAS